MKNIAVLILGYNHRSSLGDTLRSAQKQSYQNYTTYYIDNHSTDDSLEFVQNEFPEVQTLHFKKNFGYTGGYNKVLRMLFPKYDACVLLNPDVVVDFFWLEELVKSAYKNPSIGLVQPKVYLLKNNEKTHIYNTSGNIVQFLGMGYCGDYQKEDVQENDEDTPIVAVSGASLFLKKEVYEAVGELDSHFFAYLEDQDYSWRALLLGYTNIRSAKSLVWHQYDFQKNNRSHFKFFLLERNRLLFLLKHFSPLYLISILPALLVLEGGVWIDAIRNGYTKQKLHSYFSFLKLLPCALKDRRLLQKTRRCDDQSLFSLLSPEINFADVDSPLLRFANSFFRLYYKILLFFFKKKQTSL